MTVIWEVCPNLMRDDFRAYIICYGKKINDESFLWMTITFSLLHKHFSLVECAIIKWAHNNSFANDQEFNFRKNTTFISFLIYRVVQRKVSNHLFFGIGSKNARNLLLWETHLKLIFQLIPSTPRIGRFSDTLREGV